MARRREDTEALIYRIALLRHVHEQPVEKIAKAVDRTVPHVYRLLAEAEDMQIVRRNVYAPRSSKLETEIVERVATHPKWQGHSPLVQVLPSADADGDTATSLGFAVAARLDELAEKSRMVAIGGSKPMLVAARNVERRRSGPSVVATSLSQATGRVEDANAQLVATVLAERWNGLAQHYKDESSKKTKNANGLYLAMLGQPPLGSIGDLLRWHRSVALTPGFREVSRAWDRVEVAIVGVAELANDVLYQSTLRLTGGAKAMRARGGVAMFARRCIAADGSVLPLVEGSKLTSVDPAIPIEKLQQLASGKPGSRGEVILVARGARGGWGCAAALAGRLATSIICDELAATALVTAWDLLAEANAAEGARPRRRRA